MNALPPSSSKRTRGILQNGTMVLALVVSKTEGGMGDFFLEGI
jgi:hypothetical protein